MLCGTTRTDGTVDDTSCPATTETTDTSATPEAEVTSFDVGDLDCDGAVSATVSVSWETDDATSVEIALDTSRADRVRAERLDRRDGPLR